MIALLIGDSFVFPGNCSISYSKVLKKPQQVVKFWEGLRRKFKFCVLLFAELVSNVNSLASGRSRGASTTARQKLPFTQ